MSLKSRLLVYINSLLLITIIFGLLAIVIISQKNIRDEIVSTQSLAVFAIENGIQKLEERKDILPFASLLTVELLAGVFKVAG